MYNDIERFLKKLRKNIEIAFLIIIDLIFFLQNQKKFCVWLISHHHIHFIVKWKICVLHMRLSKKITDASQFR